MIAADTDALTLNPKGGERPEEEDAYYAKPKIWKPEVTYARLARDLRASWCARVSR